MSNEHAARPRPERLERKLAAILHADVQGYSRLLGEDEVTTLRTVASHLALMRSLVGSSTAAASLALVGIAYWPSFPAWWTPYRARWRCSTSLRRATSVCP